MKSCSLNPETPTPYTKRSLFCDSRRFEEALDAYESALEISPDTPETWYMMGLAFAEIEEN